MSVLGKLLGLDWLARKLGYVEQDVRTLRRDLTGLSGAVMDLQGIVRELDQRFDRHMGYGAEYLDAEGVAKVVAQYVQRVQELEAEVRSIPRPNVVEVPPQGLDAKMRKFLGAPFDASDHFKVDPTCPIGQLHEVGEKQWAVHPRTLADIEAKRLESVQLHTYGLAETPSRVRTADVCGARCDHGSECLRLRDHTGAHDTQHGCLFYDPTVRS